MSEPDVLDKTEEGEEGGDKSGDSYYSGELYMVGRRLYDPVLTVDTMNPNMVAMKHQVRRPLDVMAKDLQKELDKDSRRYLKSCQDHVLENADFHETTGHTNLARQPEGEVKPYCRVVRAHITEAHVMGQKPMTFIRQMLSCALYPDQIAKSTCTRTYPKDVKKRVREFLAACQGSLGTCVQCGGMWFVREHVAEMLSLRDGYRALPEDVILTRGGGGVYSALLRLLVAGYHKGGENAEGERKTSLESHDDESDEDSKTLKPHRHPPSVLYPVPGHPRYANLATLAGVRGVPYPLSPKKYQVKSLDLEKAYRNAGDDLPTAIVVINPGNPTGQVLTRKSLEIIVNFAQSHGLIIFSDETYEDNVYHPNQHPFISMRRMVADPPVGAGGCVQCVSAGGVSRGRAGEGGVRGGWAALSHLEPEVRDLLAQVVDAPSLPAHLVIHSVVKPPVEGEASFTLWSQESQTLQSSLAERAQYLVHSLNCLPGVSCPQVQGGLFAFPRLYLPFMIPPPAKNALDETLEENEKEEKEEAKEDVGEEGGEEEEVKELEPKDSVLVERDYCMGLSAATGVIVAPGSNYFMQPHLGDFYYRISFLPPLELLKDMVRRIREYHFSYIDRFMIDLSIFDE